MLYCDPCKPHWVPTTFAGRYFGKCDICGKDKLCMGLPVDDGEALQRAYPDGDHYQERVQLKHAC